jgi:hypothetical protein
MIYCDPNDVHFCLTPNLELLVSTRKVPPSAAGKREERRFSAALGYRLPNSLTSVAGSSFLGSLARRNDKHHYERHK